MLGLVDGIKIISNDNEYSAYIQKFVLRLEKGNKEQVRNLAKK
jgi:hypothetical protein